MKVYDIETYPNLFCLVVVDTVTYELLVFEISDRVNHGDALRSYINGLTHDPDAVMVGFGNLGFDYPIVHLMMQQPVMNAKIAYDKCNAIINASDDERFAHMVWADQRLVPQIDLFKIHHFDNVSRSTSLKMLEFNMRSKNIEDLPFPPGTVLTPEEMATTIEYCKHDVAETWSFLNKSLDRIAFREELTKRYNRDFMNHNDTKIGKDYFTMRLEEAGVPCFTTQPRRPIQTLRPSINLADAIFPSVHFEHPEFNRILDYFRSQTITETKGVFKDLNCTVDGFKFVFGVGGIHGSVSNAVFKSDRTHVIVDIDVASYYPNLAIANRVFPEHLGEKFCDIYQDVYEQRKSHPKGSVENAMLKLALNGVYGDSNNKFSQFFDPLYTMKITLNGQLLLCMLAEQLMDMVEGLQMISINTDGLCVRIPRDQLDHMMMLCFDWEQYTGLQLEDVQYSRVFVRDVNNYIAEYVDHGKLKRKGAYCYGGDLDWNQKHGGQVIAKAAEAYLVHGVPVRKFIETHTDMWDFLMATKVPRSSKLLINEVPVQNITRYYISKQGGTMIKLMPPLARKPGEWRRIGINVGWKVWPCNNIDQITAPIDYEYYIAEANKLLV